MKVIAPGGTVGIVGGGQLGRMLCLAASRLGYKTHIFSPDAGSPAKLVSQYETTAEYDDEDALTEFAESVDVITVEFENIPHTSLELLAKVNNLYPSPKLIKISQNRLREKSFINTQDIATTNYHRVSSEAEMMEALGRIKLPAILKTAELGYDGKGQRRVNDEEELVTAWDELGRVECVLEEVVAFTKEISVIVARGKNGQQACYTPVQNIHKNHILDTTLAPAPIEKELIIHARHKALTLAKASDLRGILAVEMFLTEDQRLLVNELAPRPHNSGHWTMEGCVTDQFEQTIRAVCGLPLGGTERICEVTMKNLIGDDIDGWEEHLKNPLAKLHLYGKEEARPGRKMGHVNFLKPNLD
jgi:5-(carboxyamino)imidazole ribonucleotide synthase